MLCEPRGLLSFCAVPRAPYARLRGKLCQSRRDAMAFISDVEVMDKIMKPASIRSRKSSLLVSSGIFGSVSQCPRSDDRTSSGVVSRKRCRKPSVVMHLTPDMLNGQGEAKKMRTSPTVGGCVDSHSECAMVPINGSNAPETIAGTSETKCLTELIDCAADGSPDTDEVRNVRVTKGKRGMVSIFLRPASERVVGGTANGSGTEHIEGSAKEGVNLEVDTRHRTTDKYGAAEEEHDDEEEEKAVDCRALPVGSSASSAAACTNSGSGSKCAQLLGSSSGSRTFRSPSVARLLGVGAMHGGCGANSAPGFFCYLCLLDEERAAAEKTSDDEEQEEDEVGTYPPTSSPLGSLWELMDHVSVAHVTSEMLDDGGGRSKLACSLCRSRFVVVDGVEDGYIRTVYHAHEIHGWPLPAFMRHAVRCPRCGCVLADADSLQLHQCTTHELPRYNYLVKPEEIETEGCGVAGGGCEPRWVAGRLRSPHGAVKCPACGLIRQNLVALSWHVRVCHSEGGEGLFVCPLCPCSMLLSSVHEHMRRKHGEPRPARPQKLQEVPAPGTGESAARPKSSSAAAGFVDAPQVKLEIEGDLLHAAVTLQHSDGPRVNIGATDIGDANSSVPSTLPLSGNSVPAVGTGCVPMKASTGRKAAPTNQPPDLMKQPPALLRKTIGALGHLPSSLLSPRAAVAAGRTAAAAGASTSGSADSHSSSIGLLSDERLMCTRCCKRILGAANLARHMKVIHGAVGEN